MAASWGAPDSLGTVGLRPELQLGYQQPPAPLPTKDVAAAPTKAREGFSHLCRMAGVKRPGPTHTEFDRTVVDVGDISTGAVDYTFTDVGDILTGAVDSTVDAALSCDSLDVDMTTSCEAIFQCKNVECDRHPPNPLRA